MTSKYSNPMISKGDIGTRKPFYQKVPADDFVYGKPVFHDRENATDCKNA